jgi:hypothetical protein
MKMINHTSTQSNISNLAMSKKETGAVLIEMLLITPVMLLMGFWTLSFTQVTRERAIASELASQAAQLALLYCSDEFMVDKSKDDEINPDIVDPTSSVAQVIEKSGRKENCLDQIKIVLESLSGLNDLPPYDIHINVWRLPPATSSQNYTRCFTYPTGSGQADLQPMADDGVCARADVILASSDVRSGKPSLDFSTATGPAYRLVGGGTIVPFTAGQINTLFPVDLGKRMVIHAVAVLETEAFDLTVGGLFGAGSYSTSTKNKYVAGHAIL